MDSQFRPDGQRQRWTFEEAIVAFDKALRGYGLRRGIEREGEAGPKDEGARPME